jgi:hypothetical protein
MFMQSGVSTTNLIIGVSIMHLHNIRKRALYSAMSLALGCGVMSSAGADITLTFANNTSPSATPPLTPGGSIPFPSGTEFRVHKIRFRE